MLTVYKSSAGAGKTFTLAKRYITLLFEAHQLRGHRRILAVTFTKKATAEMKQRIVKELAALARGGKSDYATDLRRDFGLSAEQLRERAAEILIELLQDYSAFQVTTIDSFFQQIIRSFSRELNLSGSYNVELSSDQVLNRAVDDFFYNLPPQLDDTISRTLLRIVEENIENQTHWDPKQKILSLSKELLKEVWQTNQAAMEALSEDDTVLPALQKELEKVEADYYAKVKAVQEQLPALLGGVDETEFPNGAKMFAPFHYDKEKILLACQRKQSTKLLRNRLNEGADSLKKVHLRPVWEKVAPVAGQLLDLFEGAEAKRMLTAIEVLNYLPYLAILNSIAACIRLANKDLNRLPIAQTNELLHRVVAEDDAPFIYDKIGTRISHFMIDEFQDTSAMQWANFRPLMKETDARGGKNLIVGDVKQSIYRWRNSDLELLQNSVQKEFPYAKEEPLNANWRSDREVVLQNNFLFHLLSENAQESYDTALRELSIPLEEEALKNVYRSVEQIPKKEDETGYVEIRFVEKTKKEETNAAILAQLPALLHDLQQRHIPLGRVAFLVRKNAEAALIANTLVDAGFKVMTNEGLLLASSPAVRLCLTLLRLSLTPDDRLLRLQANYDFAVLSMHDKQEALQKALLTDLDERLQPFLQPSAESLYQQVATICQFIGEQQRQSQNAYLQAFADCVLTYSETYQADTYSFLDWWDNVGSSTSLQMQPDDDAVQILTVHKSKGLEYDVVIIPFCNWDLTYNPTQTNILWVKPTAEPYNRLPLLPLKYSSQLAYTDFAEDWKQELRRLYLDCLNVTYVAFTRAKRELYVFAASSFGEKEMVKPTDTIGELLYASLQAYMQDDCYIRGEKVQEKAETNSVAAETVIPAQNIRLLSHKHIKVRLSSQAAFTSSATDLHSVRNLGTVMHNILCEIHHWEDAEPVLKRYMQEGLLTKQDLQTVRHELRQLRSLTSSTDWFAPQWTVLTEQDILLPNGTTRRPDRIMLSGRSAVIVDWKFGYKQPQENIDQVREYMQLLTAMNYEVKGYLCYVNRKEIVEIV